MISLFLALCTLNVQGSALVYAKVYYAHEDPEHHGQRYSFITPPLHVTDATVEVVFEGHPTGVEWYYISSVGETHTLVKTCGEVNPIYPLIFADGFETGDLTQWKEPS
jgi:hypothetical protein